MGFWNRFFGSDSGKVSQSELVVDLDDGGDEEEIEEELGEELGEETEEENPFLSWIESLDAGSKISVANRATLRLEPAIRKVGLRSIVMSDEPGGRKVHADFKPIMAEWATIRAELEDVGTQLEPQSYEGAELALKRVSLVFKMLGLGLLQLNHGYRESGGADPELTSSVMQNLYKASVFLLSEESALRFAQLLSGDCLEFMEGKAPTPAYEGDGAGEIPPIHEVAEELDAGITNTFDVAAREAAANPEQVLGDDGRFVTLWDLLAQAEVWGKANGWPAFENYPQYAEIRAIGSALHDEGGKQKMQAMYYMVREKSFDYAETLNNLWHLCGSWMR